MTNFFDFSSIYQFLKSEPLLANVIFFVLGTCIGSFLNVCIYRLPDEEKSVVKPSSYCPACKKSLPWYDNIPVLSFLILRAKCRSCQEPISVQYPLMEIATGGIFVGVFGVFGYTPYAIFMIYLICSLLVASIIDFKFKIIPDEITFYGMLFALFCSFLFPQVQGENNSRLGIANSIIGLLAGGGLVYVLAIFGDFIFKKESMGGGDIKLLAMIGAFLGWKAAIFSFLLSPYAAIFTALYYKFYKKESVIPYGPFLSIGAIGVLFFGNQILSILGV